MSDYTWTQATLAIVAAALLAPASATIAQQIQQGGNALDNNLRLGSGGYNGRGSRAGGGGAGGGRPLRETIYRGQHGHIDYHTAFTQQRRYDPGRRTAFHDDPRRFVPGGAASGPTAGGSRFGEGWDKGYAAGLADGGELVEMPESAKIQMQEISYALGYFLGEEVRAGLEQDGVEADFETVLRGFRDGLFDNVPRLPRAFIEEILAKLEGEVEARLVEGLRARDPEFRELTERNLQSSRAFHDEFGRREGVVTLPNGIQYQVLAEGAGRKPGPDDYVVLSYKVILLDGSVLARGTAEEVRVGAVVDGASQALQMMSPGAVWLIAIPPELAHGPGGKYPEIGPNVTLFAEVELIRFKEAD
ncbi:MAG: FKBP-type peptidyl-prolyl cis-trans isomerase N-terminal domain-containing protein [Phycisphaerales bacterium]